MPRGDRRLAAVMFTDIVGYTNLSQTDEPLALELLDEHRGLVRRVLRANRGIEVKTIGDAFLVEFRSALDAVQCAVQMQEGMTRRNERVPPSRRIEIRVGIHVGDVVHDGGDIFGDAVNVASRIESLASPGGVCISQQVFDQIRNKAAGLEVRKVGDVRLKNVELPLGIYSVSSAASVGPDERKRNVDETGRPDSERSMRRSKKTERLCVLPFVNISSDPNDEYFADGLTEELITKISERCDLKVIARTSAMSYKRKDKKISDIARELDVDSVIEGSVRKSGNRVRISVQLIDASTEERMWSSNYDSELTDIFAIQSDVAASVASSLATGVSSPSEKRETRSIEAYTSHLRAVQLWREGTASSMREAIVLFERAVSKDPKFARAHAGLARAWGSMGVIGYEEFAVAAEKAEAAARRALAIDPKLAESHSAMAMVHFLNDRFDASLEESEEAIRINPNDVDSHVELGVLHSLLGSQEDAFQEFHRAYELDPLSISIGDLLAQAAGLAGKKRLKWEILTRLREFNPKNPRVFAIIAEYHIEEKNFEDAQKMIDIARRLSPEEPPVRLVQGELYALMGRRDEAEEVLKLILTDERESVRLFGRLTIHTALGNLDEAFEALDRMAEIHAWPYLIVCDPYYKGLREDPRFIEFRRKVGLRAPSAFGNEDASKAEKGRKRRT